MRHLLDTERCLTSRNLSNRVMYKINLTVATQNKRNERARTASFRDGRSTLVVPCVVGGAAELGWSRPDCIRGVLVLSGVACFFPRQLLIFLASSYQIIENLP